MNATIYKHTLKPADRQSLNLRAGSKILSVQVQGNSIQLWELHGDQTRGYVERVFVMFGTGHMIAPPDEYKQLVYIATIQHGGFVWHVFEETFLVGGTSGIYIRGRHESAKG